MKKLFLALLMLCLGVGVWAQDVDYTSYIVGADCETLGNWELSGSANGPKTNGDAYDGNLIETTGWGVNATGSITQTVTGLPSGLYELNFVYMAAEGTCRAKVTANEQTTGELTGTGTANGNTGVKGWHRIALPVYVYDGTLKITAEGKNGSDNEVWTNFDDFHLILKEKFTDRTSLIVNPKADGNIDGWTGTNGSVKYNPSSDADRFEGGLFELCDWGNSWDLTLSQTISEAPNGKYKVTCVWQANTTIEIKANNETSGTLTGHGTSGGNTNIGGWDYVEVPVTITDGNLTIAVHGTADSKEKWANADNFHLLYYPASVGSPAIDDANGIVPGQQLRITFPYASNDNPSATLTLDPSKVSGVSGVTVDNEAFVFTVPSSWALGSQHTITLAAGAATYGNDASSEAATLTFTTANIQPGTYFLKTEDNRYLTRGSNWGTRACVDELGMPVNLIAISGGAYRIQFVDSKQNLFNATQEMWCDRANNDEAEAWSFIAVSNGKYRMRSKQRGAAEFVKLDTGNNRLYSDGTTDTVIVNWTLMTPTNRNLAATKATLREAAVALKSEADAKSSHKTYVTNNPTATAEQYQDSGNNLPENILTRNITVAPGIYKFSIHAFNRVASNDVAYNLHNQNGADCQFVYAYFDDKEVLIKSVYEDDIEGNNQCYVQDGKNYPNGQGSALRGFQQGKYLNTIYVRVTEEKTINYGLKKVSTPHNNAHWTCWATDGIEITRYYDPATDGREFEEQANYDYNYVKGDINNDNNITIGDVAREVHDILTNKTENRHKMVNDTPNAADVEAIAKVVAGIDEPSSVNELWRFNRLNGTICANQKDGYIKDGYTLTGLLENVNYSANADAVATIPNHLTRINVTASGISNISSISVYAKGKEMITGPMTVDYRNGEKLLNLTTSAGTATGGTIYTNGATMESDVVRIETTSSTATFHLRPVDLSQGVTVTVQTTDGKFYSQDLATVNTGKENAVTVTTANDHGAWMATIPGTVGFTALSLAGAHDAATKSCSTSAAKCQSKDITGLLNCGVRFLDLRPKGTAKNSLTIYHGTSSTGVKFETALENVKQYLIANPSEMVVIIIHDEGATEGTNLENWGKAITAWLEDYSDYIKVIDKNVNNNKLADCRGKMVVITRDAIANTNLAVKTGWPDNNADYSNELTFCNGGGTGITLKFQDEYDNRNTGTRLTAIENFQSSNVPTDGNRYVITINGANIAWKITDNPTKYPKDYAKTINAAILSSTTFTGCNTRFGILVGDYMGDSSCSGDQLVNFIIKQNYKYVYNGLGK